jgi:hypothetical protein
MGGLINRTVSFSKNAQTQLSALIFNMDKHNATGDANKDYFTLLPQKRQYVQTKCIKSSCSHIGNFWIGSVKDGETGAEPTRSVADYQGAIAIARTLGASEVRILREALLRGGSGDERRSE